MQIALNLFGILLGIAFAVTFHRIGGFLRRSSISLLVTVIGWSVFAFAIVLLGGLGFAWWQAHTHPKTLSPINVKAFSATLFVLLSLLLCLCVGLGAIHSHRYNLPWMRTVSVVMIEVGLVAGCIWFLQENLYFFADMLRAGNRDVGRILYSFRQIYEMLGCLHLAMGVALLALEFMPPLGNPRIAKMAKEYLWQDELPK